MLGIVEELEELEVMRRVLLCMREAVEGRLCLLEVLEALEARRRYAVCYSVCWGSWRVSSV